MNDHQHMWCTHSKQLLSEFTSKVIMNKVFVIVQFLFCLQVHIVAIGNKTEEESRQVEFSIAQTWANKEKGEMKFLFC